MWDGVTKISRFLLESMNVHSRFYANPAISYPHVLITFKQTNKQRGQEEGGRKYTDKVSDLRRETGERKIGSHREIDIGER